MHDVDEYLKGKLAELHQDLQQGLHAGLQGAFSSCEPMRGNIAQLGIQQEGIVQEISKTVARMGAVENAMTATMMAGTNCPCINGRCPCKCNNAAAGAAAQRPTVTPATFYMSPGAAPVPDSAWNHWKKDDQPGGQGGGGPNGPGCGGGGGGGPNGPGPVAATFIPTPPGIEKTITMTSKVFEGKTARDKAIAYDGNPDNGATWRSDVYDYFVSKWPDCEPWLSWAEEQGATAITPGAIDDHKRSGVAMTEIDPYVFNHHVWGVPSALPIGPSEANIQSRQAAGRNECLAAARAQD
jgi:hypothetical protein